MISTRRGFFALLGIAPAVPALIAAVPEATAATAATAVRHGCDLSLFIHTAARQAGIIDVSGILSKCEYAHALELLRENIQGNPPYARIENGLLMVRWHSSGLRLGVRALRYQLAADLARQYWRPAPEPIQVTTGIFQPIRIDPVWTAIKIRQT